MQLPPDPAFDARLRRLARTLLRDEAGADDVVQEVWLASLQHPPSQFDDAEAWFRAVTRNIAYKEARTRERRTHREKESARPERIDEAALDLEVGEMRARLERAVDDLDEPYRETIRARYFEELPIDAIADRFGRPSSTVKSHLRRGVDRLRAQLERDVGDRRALGVALVGGFDWVSEDLTAAEEGVAATTFAAGTAATVRAVALALLAVVPVTVAVVALRAGDGADDVPTVEIARGEAPSVGGPEADPVASPATSERAPIAAGRGSGTTAPLDAAGDDRAAEVATPAGGPVFEVHVIDARGTPVAGAEIRALDGAQETVVATTASDGIARVAASDAYPLDRPAIAPAGLSVALLARSPGHADSWRHYPLVGTLHRVQLRLRGESFTARGVVVGTGGAPIAGATVTVATDPTLMVGRNSHGVATEVVARTAASGDDGTFELGGLRRERMSLVAFHAGHGSGRISVAGQDADGGSLEIELAPFGELTGRVTDAGGRPLVGVRISIEPVGIPEVDSVVVLSDDDGDYRYPGLPSGRVTARYDGEGDARATVPLAVQPGEVVRRDVVLETERTLRVRLVDADGAPVKAAQVFVRQFIGGWRRSATVDPDGRVEFEAPPNVGPDGVLGQPVDLVVRPIATGYPFAIATRRLDRLPTRPMEITCRPLDEFTGWLEGFVFDDAGWPVTDGKLVVREPDALLVGRYLLDADTGHFDANRLPVGPVELFVQTQTWPRYYIRTFESDGGRHDLGTIELPEPATLNVDWGLTDEGGPLRHRLDLVTYNGRGYGGRVPLSDGTGPIAPRWTLQPGLYMARVNRADGERIFVRFLRLTSGSERTLEIRTEAPELVHVEMTWLSGAPRTMSADVYVVGDVDHRFPVGTTDAHLREMAADGVLLASLEPRPAIDGTFQFEWEASEPAMLVLHLATDDGWQAWRFFRYGLGGGAMPYNSYDFAR
ncbi:MAG: sigma-70 family RNA polymerase sigma factor [Planctomycetota bacterium]